jgi:hypothetical protein
VISVGPQCLFFFADFLFAAFFFAIDSIPPFQSASAEIGEELGMNFTFNE